MIGRITDAGMEGIDDTEGAAEDGSTCEIPLVACVDAEVKWVDVGRAVFTGS
jgi:hypothetical protein